MDAASSSRNVILADDVTNHARKRAKSTTADFLNSDFDFTGDPLKDPRVDGRVETKLPTGSLPWKAPPMAPPAPPPMPPPAHLLAQAKRETLGPVCKQEMDVVPPQPQMYDASKYSEVRWCLGGGNPDKLPDDYGYWLGWNHPD